MTDNTPTQEELDREAALREQQLQAEKDAAKAARELAKEQKRTFKTARVNPKTGKVTVK